MQVGPLWDYSWQKGVPLWEWECRFWNSWLMPDVVWQVTSPKALLRYIRDKLWATLDPEVVIVPGLSQADQYGSGPWYGPHAIHSLWAIRQWAGEFVHHTIAPLDSFPVSRGWNKGFTFNDRLLFGYINRQSLIAGKTMRLWRVGQQAVISNGHHYLTIHISRPHV